MKTLLAAGVSVALFFTAPATYTISGTVPTKASCLYSLIQRNRSLSAASSVRSLTVRKGGDRFEIQGVAPGIYDLYVLSSDAEGRQIAGKIHLQVDNRNLTGAAIDMQPFVDIEGRFIVQREVFTERSPKISLKPKELPAPYWMQSMAVADEDGSFTLFDVAQGSYTIGVSGLSGGYRVTEIHMYGKVFQPSDSLPIVANATNTMEIVIDRVPTGSPIR